MRQILGCVSRGSSADHIRVIGRRCVRMPALSEFPMINVVQPAYHWDPNGGQGSFLPLGRCLLSWDRVFATGDRSDVSVGGPAHGQKRHTLSRICDSCEYASARLPIAPGQGSQLSSPISSAPAVEPAMMDRRTVGPPFFTAGGSSFAVAEAMVLDVGRLRGTEVL